MLRAPHVRVFIGCVLDNIALQGWLHPSLGVVVQCSHSVSGRNVERPLSIGNVSVTIVTSVP